MAWNPNIPTVTNRVQDDLNAIRENFQHLDQSRIVEMGSNSNGEYVRWENGLQVCWIYSLGVTFSNSTASSATWTFPAAFSVEPISLPVARGGISGYTMEFSVDLSTSRVNIVAKLDISDSVTRNIAVFAIGRYK